jgi:phenylpropionate dioxygenase-like ring-hydroxylating dioxygenase large terminal subunit
MTETITGTNRSAGISYTELLDQDTHPVSDVIRRESNMEPGNTRVPAKAYYSQEWHDLEVEKLWSKTWQMACLEDEIPEVGDYYVYDIAHLSFLVVRSAPNEIKAYRNACLHRGRKLRECDGRGAKNLRCAFHGWSWKLDGSLKEIPCEWDFPELDKNFYDLPEAKVGTWQGFVFINPDRDAEPLSEYLKGLDEHFTHLPFTKRQKVAHVAKIMPVNWKACAEAFMESYHVVATHPTLMVDMGDANSRYDVYGNFSRAISPRGIESPHLANMRHYDQLPDGRHFARWRHPMSGFIYEREGEGLARVIDHDDNVSIFTEDGVWVSGPLTQADPHMCKWVGGPMLEGMENLPMMIPTAPDGVTNLRAHMADTKRAQLREKYGPDAIDLENASDSEMIDAIFYSVFPNWSPWGCFHELMYRWRPNGDNPNECIYEVMKWVPAPNGRTAPPAKVRHLGLNDDWTIATELGATSKIFQQDSVNLPHVQTGLKAQEQQEVVLASYNETKLRHFWKHMFEVLGVENQPVQVRRK